MPGAVMGWSATNVATRTGPATQSTSVPRVSLQTQCPGRTLTVGSKRPARRWTRALDAVRPDTSSSKLIGLLVLVPPAASLASGGRRSVFSTVIDARASSPCKAEPPARFCTSRKIDAGPATVHDDAVHDALHTPSRRVPRTRVIRRGTLLPNAVCTEATTLPTPDWGSPRCARH